LYIKNKRGQSRHSIGMTMDVGLPVFRGSASLHVFVFIIRNEIVQGVEFAQ